MNSAEYLALDSEYVLHTYGRMPVVPDHGQNEELWDVDGKHYYDFTAGIGVNALGYSDPGWVKAVTEQAAKIQHVSNYYVSPVNAALAKALCEAAGMARAFFVNSGAEANECAIKVARKFGETKGANVIVTLENSFHGRTLTTLAATGQPGFHELFRPLTEGFVHVPGNDLPALEKAIDENVCAVLLETVQGEGGVVPMDGAYLKAVRKLCDQKGVLLMLDEVQTGVGRTGDFYSYQGAGIQPDVVTTAKGLAGGLPMAACLVAEPLRDIFAPGMNGTTFGSNPVASAGALEVVRRVSDPAFLAEVREKGAYMAEKLRAMPNVELVRGRGLMLGILVKGQDAHSVQEKCAEKGLLVLTAKEAVRFLPPLTITKAGIDAGLAIFEQVIS